MPRGLCSLCRLFSLFALLVEAMPARGLDLKDAVVVSASELSGPEQKAVSMLVEEVEKRTRIRWVVATNQPSSNAPVIAIGPRSKLDQFAGAYANALKSLAEVSGAEGYRLCIKRDKGNPAVFVIGNNARGVLFGVGRLLRELHMQNHAAGI